MEWITDWTKGRNLTAAHVGLILEVLNRVKNIVLHGKKKRLLAGQLGGGGGGTGPSAPLWIRACIRPDISEFK